LARASFPPSREFEELPRDGPLSCTFFPHLDRKGDCSPIENVPGERPRLAIPPAFFFPPTLEKTFFVGPLWRDTSIQTVPGVFSFWRAPPFSKGNLPLAPLKIKSLPGGCFFFHAFPTLLFLSRDERCFSPWLVLTLDPLFCPGLCSFFPPPFPLCFFLNSSFLWARLVARGLPFLLFVLFSDLCWGYLPFFFLFFTDPRRSTFLSAFAPLFFAAEFFFPPLFLIFSPFSKNFGSQFS